MPPLPLNIEIEPSLKRLKTFVEGLPVDVKLIILCDHHTHSHCLPILNRLSTRLSQSHIIKIPAGENSKSAHVLFEILEQLTTQQATRNSILINLGGGVVTDIGAFAASIYKRGMRCVHIPTSLLAQLDAAIGGKNGIDFMGYKNLLGTFYLPERIFISTLFLETLPSIEKRNGLAEALKHALIDDKDHWNSIKTNPLSELQTLLARSIEIKTAIVDRDPFEKNIRKKLNAGHTIGHALESWCLEIGTPISHGEAVAAGLIIESHMSFQKGYLTASMFEEIESHIFTIFGKIPMFEYNSDGLIERMKQDKKNSNAKISFSLIREIGNVTFDDYCDDETILKALKYYALK